MQNSLLYAPLVSCFEIYIVSVIYIIKFSLLCMPAAFWQYIRKLFRKVEPEGGKRSQGGRTVLVFIK